MGILKYLLSSQLKYSKEVRRVSGFTLIELLVAMILAVLVLSPLLGFMINILETDRKEQAKSTSEQEVQTALDYISRDLQQAIYVYDADALSKNSNTDPKLSGIKDQIPPVKNAGNCQDAAQCQPVLAFWKRKIVKEAIAVGTGKDDTFVYSLVTYYLIKDDSSKIWSKAARIARFEISDGVQNVGTTGGFSCSDYPGEKFISDKYCPDKGFKRFDISEKGSSIQEKMNRWKATTTAYTQDANVLIDFVDQTPVSAANPDLPTATCPPDEKNTDGTFKIKWSKITPNNLTGFYACVETKKTLNNTVQVNLRGNALARVQKDSIDYKKENQTYFPSASIQVEGRGYLYTQ
jgi:prepilin-type N-terminal cleavage/methylation domain-containing protein